MLTESTVNVICREFNSSKALKGREEVSVCPFKTVPGNTGNPLTGNTVHLCRVYLVSMSKTLPSNDTALYSPSRSNTAPNVAGASSSVARIPFRIVRDTVNHVATMRSRSATIRQDREIIVTGKVVPVSPKK